MAQSLDEAADCGQALRAIIASGFAPLSRLRFAPLSRRGMAVWPLRRHFRRERHGEGVEQVGDQRVVAAERDELDHALVAEQPAGRVVAALVELPGLGELARDGVDDALVVGLERRLVAAADRLDGGTGHAVLARHPGMRPPLEL